MIELDHASDWRLKTLFDKYIFLETQKWLSAFCLSDFYLLSFKERMFELDTVLQIIYYVCYCLYNDWYPKDPHDLS